jgi:hypothetical protein
MAEYIDPGMAPFDPSTFEASRLMYWPSCCADSEYVYVWEDKPLLSADGILATYSHWHDVTAWPQVPGAAVSPQRLAAKQGDPEAKSGVVGAFCRVYDIYGAIDKFLPGVYEPVDSSPDRYTFTGGSTTGGAVVYDDGKFLYSHHATDPCSGKLVNAFDLVRLHLYDDRDDTVKDGTPANRLPSYVAMCELAVTDPNVSALMAQERYQEAVKDFDGVESDNTGDAANWMLKLQRHPQTGVPLCTIDNAWLVLENDPQLKDKFALNEFAGRGEILTQLPWSARAGRRLWTITTTRGSTGISRKLTK